MIVKQKEFKEFTSLKKFINLSVKREDVINIQFIEGIGYTWTYLLFYWV